LLHRLVGQVADHLPRKLYWRDQPEPPPLIPDLQGLDLRDIDPTDLRRIGDDNRSDAEAIWHPSSPYVFHKGDLTDERWVRTKDLTSVKEALLSSGLGGNRPALVISEYASWRLPPHSGTSEYPYGRVSRSLHSGFLPANQLLQFSKALRKKSTRQICTVLSRTIIEDILRSIPTGSYTPRTEIAVNYCHRENQ
jgi:hypothetical protein